MCNYCLDISPPPSMYEGISKMAQWKIYRGQVSIIYRNNSFFLYKIIFFKQYSIRPIIFKPFYIVTGVETSLFKKKKKSIAWGWHNGKETMQWK